MGITVTRANLLSRAVRQIAAGSGLTRSLNVNPSLKSNKEDGSGQSGIARLISSIAPWASRFLGFISSILRGVQITVSAIFGVVVNSIMTLSTFDWAASDKEIGAMIQGNNVAIASAWGGAIGAGVGWFAGIAVGYGITLLCPVIGSASLAKLVAGEVSAEALQEVGATTVNALRQTTRALGSNVLLASYRKFRKFFGYNPPDDAPSWTIAGKLEEKIDSIKNPLLKAFIEEFTDEFFDSFVEAGYVFAYELDAQIAAARAAAKGGLERAVRITPDSEVPDESIILVGNEDQLKLAVQTTLAGHKLVHNRDVGQIVGQPAEDWYRAKPHRRKLTILFTERERPPWQLAGNKSPRRATYTIPEPKATLDWSQIKKAAKAYNWGKYRCTANLTNGRQMAVYAASPQEAREKLEDLLSLSTCEILTMSVAEEVLRHNRLKKEPTRMFPAYGTVLVRKPTTDRSGRTDIDGNTWDEDHVRFELWTKNEPDSFKKVKW